MEWGQQINSSHLTSPEVASQTLIYDEMAQLARFNNELGEQWRYNYDLLGQVSSTYQPESDIDIHFNYDPRGNFIARQYNSNSNNNNNSNSNSSANQQHNEQFSFDGLGCLASISSATLTERYHSDGVNNLVQVSNQILGEDFNYQYDANG